MVVNLAGWNDPALLVQLMQILGGVYNNTKTTKNTPDMAHKHHSKEARLLTVKEQNGGRSAFEICKEMNFSPGTLKRWRDQLHLLGWDNSVFGPAALISGGGQVLWLSCY